MSDSIRLINLGRVPDWQTQAVYHAVAEAMTTESPDTLILCQPASPYLCLGYHQSYDAVLDRAECERRHLPVFRRQVGGGATYLDSNQLFYQCVFHRSRMPAVFAAVFAQMLEAPVATLQRLGLNAVLREINEIEVGGKRIAGTGGGQIGEACVVVGNILFDFDYDAMVCVLKVPSESCRGLVLAALRDSITTLHRLNRSDQVDALEQMLIEEFARALKRPLETGALTAIEMERSREKGARLRSAEFLKLHSDPAIKPLKISARTSIRFEQFELDGQQICANLVVRDGVIENALLESDPPQPWGDFKSRLCGVPFSDWQNFL